MAKKVKKEKILTQEEMIDQALDYLFKRIDRIEDILHQADQGLYSMHNRLEALERQLDDLTHQFYYHSGMEQNFFDNEQETWDIGYSSNDNSLVTNKLLTGLELRGNDGKEK